MTTFDTYDVPNWMERRAQDPFHRFLRKNAVDKFLSIPPGIFAVSILSTWTGLMTQVIEINLL